MKLDGAEEPQQGAPKAINTSNIVGMERHSHHKRCYFKATSHKNTNEEPSTSTVSYSAATVVTQSCSSTYLSNHNRLKTYITLQKDMSDLSQFCEKEIEIDRNYDVNVRKRITKKTTKQKQIQQREYDHILHTINENITNVLAYSIGSVNNESKNLLKNTTNIKKCNSNILKNVVKTHNFEMIQRPVTAPVMPITKAPESHQRARYFNSLYKCNTKSNRDKNIDHTNTIKSNKNQCCEVSHCDALQTVIEVVSISMLRVQQYLIALNGKALRKNRYVDGAMLHWTSLQMFPMRLKMIPLTIMSLLAVLKRISFSHVYHLWSAFGVRSLLQIILLLFLLPMVYSDDNDNFFAINSFSMGPETTTPEFDYASRGQKKFGDKCENTIECGFPGSICDSRKKSCQCTEDLPVTNHIDKCGKEAAVNESCFFNEQCEVKYFQTECRDGRCVCRFEMTPIWGKDGSVECKAGRQDKRGPETYIDPAMIGVLVGMALMFIIICVVLRLFSQARWRENRTIFNTPNPRLMNVSLLRDSKLLHGQERRGSRMSVRAPSRQPSMASLRPHSPNPSLGKTGSRSGSASASNASAASIRSTRSNSVAPGNIVTNSHHERKGSQFQQQQHQHMPLITNITSNPVAESVTVEIIEPVNREEN